MAKDEKDLILTEYARFSEFLWRNEEVGEKRVNYYLGLITAVFAGLLTLASSDFGDEQPLATAAIAAASEAALLAVGRVTHRRMRKRKQVTTEYQGILDRLRKRFFETLEPPGVRYVLFEESDEGKIENAGLPALVYTLNAIVAAALLATVTRFVVLACP